MAGWACAVPALVFATFSYIYSAHRLLECWKVEDARQRLLAQRMEEIQDLLGFHSTNNNNYHYQSDYGIRNLRNLGPCSIVRAPQLPARDRYFHFRRLPARSRSAPTSAPIRSRRVSCLSRYGLAARADRDSSDAVIISTGTTISVASDAVTPGLANVKGAAGNSDGPLKNSRK